MHTITHHFRIFKHFARQSLIRELQFRGDWLFNQINMLAWSLERLVFYSVTFSVITVVNQWDFPRSLILTGVFMICHGFHKSLFEDNLKFLVKCIYHGDLDFYLTKPLSSQFAASLRIINTRATSRFIVGITMLILGLNQAGITFTLSHFIFFSFVIVCSILITYAMIFMLVASSFWLGNIDALSSFPNVLTGMSFIPYDVFPKSAVTFLTYILPLMFMATIPAKFIIHPTPNILVISLIVTIIMLTMSRFVWNLGLSTYSSASS